LLLLLEEVDAGRRRRWRGLIVFMVDEFVVLISRCLDLHFLIFLFMTRNAIVKMSRYLDKVLQWIGPIILLLIKPKSLRHLEMSSETARD
jgi:hypothetical protein